MSHHHHLSITEREKLLVLHTEQKSLRSISEEMGRSISTISRELSRKSGTHGKYSAIKAQHDYLYRRKKCRRAKLLENEELKMVIQKLFLEQQWSPEQISNRLAYENSPYQISYNTIYRGIYAGMFDTDVQKYSTGNRRAIKKLRHKGKLRRGKGNEETRGKIVISNRIQERPIEAEQRKVIGHWEADTLLGKVNSVCLVTITDRRSRYLLAGKIDKKWSELLANKMISMFSGIPKDYLKTVTPDRGKEFAKHKEVTAALGGIQFYFPDPHAPWQRGTSENTNGLLREYFPKSFEIGSYSDDDIAVFVDKLNRRPRKCLNWRTPHEVFFDQLFHLT